MSISSLSFFLHRHAFLHIFSFFSLINHQSNLDWKFLRLTTVQLLSVVVAAIGGVTSILLVAIWGGLMISLHLPFPFHNPPTSRSTIANSDALYRHPTWPPFPSRRQRPPSATPILLVAAWAGLMISVDILFPFHNPATSAAPPSLTAALSIATVSVAPSTATVGLSAKFQSYITAKAPSTFLLSPHQRPPISLLGCSKSMRFMLSVCELTTKSSRLCRQIFQPFLLFVELGALRLEFLRSLRDSLALIAFLLYRRTRRRQHLGSLMSLK